jgi:hypothetical protein
MKWTKLIKMCLNAECAAGWLNCVGLDLAFGGRAPAQYGLLQPEEFEGAENQANVARVIRADLVQADPSETPRQRARKHLHGALAVEVAVILAPVDFFSGGRTRPPLEGNFPSRLAGSAAMCQHLTLTLSSASLMSGW